MLCIAFLFYSKGNKNVEYLGKLKPKRQFSQLCFTNMVYSIFLSDVGLSRLNGFMITTVLNRHGRLSKRALPGTLSR